MINKQMEGKAGLLKKMMQVEAKMFQKVKLSKENSLKIEGLNYLEKNQIRVIESIFTKSATRPDIFGQPKAKIFKRIKEAKLAFVNREEEVLKLYQQKIDKITQQLLQLDKNMLKIYFGKEDCKFDSNIINRDAVFDREFIFKSLTAPIRPSSLKLLFRASENGFLASKFHQKCDNIQNTLTLIKTQFGKVIAGYTPIKWASNIFFGNQADPNSQSFLLSFSMKQKMPLSKTQAAISTYSGSGPSFGGKDIHIADRCNQNKKSYTKFPDSYHYSIYMNDQLAQKSLSGAKNGQGFRVLEYQVFEVIW